MSQLKERPEKALLSGTYKKTNVDNQMLNKNVPVPVY
jgi:hypothetical protein